MKKWIFFPIISYLLILVITFCAISFGSIDIASYDNTGEELANSAKVFSEIYQDDYSEEETKQLLNQVFKNTGIVSIVVNDEKDIVWGDLENNASKVIKIDQMEKTELYIRELIVDFKKGNEPPNDFGNEEVNFTWKNGMQYVLIKDKYTNEESAFSFVEMSNGSSIVVAKPIVEDHKEGNLRRRIYISVALVVVISTIIVYLMATVLSSSIVQLKEKVSDISNLDFTNTKPLKGPREIVMLDRSFNELSHKLENSMGMLNETNEKLQIELEKRSIEDEQRKQFVSNVSHELKTPVSIIKSHAEALLDEVGDRDYYTKSIYEEAETMEEMILELLYMFKMEQEVNEENFVDINVSDIVNKQIVKFQNTALKENKKIEYYIEEGLHLKFDKLKIEYIINNLMQNGIKHGTRPEVRVELYKNIENNKMVFSVFNKCDEMSDEVIENIWVRFYKGSSYKDKNFSGTGLGLSIVNGIVKKVNGNCYASYINGGLEIKIEI